MKKKYWLPLLMIVSLLFLAGWGKKQVELLNDKKLIDLNAAIGICMPGADTSDHNAYDQDSGERRAQEAQTGTDSAGDEEKIIVIRIRGEKVTYDSVQLTGLDSLKNRIRQDCGDKVSFRLMDDFAEAHVYKEVLKMLSELKSETGLTYTRE